MNFFLKFQYFQYFEYHYISGLVQKDLSLPSKLCIARILPLFSILIYGMITFTIPQSIPIRISKKLVNFHLILLQTAFVDLLDDVV